MNRKLSILVAFMVMMIMGTSITLATDYVPPPGTSSAEGTSACISLDGEAGAVFDGNLTQIDAANNFVNIDFWWRGEPNSPENYVFLEGLVFANIYQPLAGTLWRFPVNTCSREQAYAKFNEHVAARQADPTVNSGFVITWEQSGIFVPVEVDTNTAPAADPAMDPAPASQDSGNFWDDMDTSSDPIAVQETSTVTTQTAFVEASLEDPFNQNGDTEGTTPAPVPDQNMLSELCRSDDAAAQLASLTGLSLAASRDVCNAQADPTQWCGAHQDYDLLGHPELATAASYIVPHFEPFNGNGDLVTVIPHGRYRMAREKGFPGHAWEFGVNCTYDQVYAMTHLYLQSKGLSPDVFRVYDDPAAFNGYFSMITYQGDYRGGNQDPERDSPVCRMGKRKFLLENLGGVIARNDDRFPDRWNGYVSMQPWKSGTPEYETWEYIPDDKALVYDDSTIGGSIWFAYGNCTDQWMVGNAQQSHNSRVGQYADNEKDFKLVKNLEGSNSPIRGWFRLQ